MLTVCTWLWGDKYNKEDVAKLAGGVRRHLKQPYQFVVFADNDIERFEMSCVNRVVRISTEDLYLLEHKGCFVRLRIFDPEMQKFIGADERIVSIDLDTIITGPLDPLFDRPESFVILHGGNSQNPCPFNGGLQMLRAGTHRRVWSEFSLDKARETPFFEFPDDQGWFWSRMPNAAGWKVGPESGCYVFRKPGWPGAVNLKIARESGAAKIFHKEGWPGPVTAEASDELPEGARLVTFSGKRSPGQFPHLSWIYHHWRA